MLKVVKGLEGFSLTLILLLSLQSCKDGICDRDFYVEVTGLSMLEEAEIINCEDNLEWFTIAAFQLDESQVRELLDSGNFNPVRSSLDMINYPLEWVNKLFEEIDELSQYRPKTSDKINCTMTLKEDDQILIVSIVYPDWSGN